MKTIYRSEKWVDGTDRIEVDDGRVNFISKRGVKDGCCGWTPVMCAEACEKYGWTKEVVDLGDYPKTPYEELRALAQAVVDNGPCSDPDCCPTAVACEKARNDLKAFLERSIVEP